MQLWLFVLKIYLWIYIYNFVLIYMNIMGVDGKGFVDLKKKKKKKKKKIKNF